jgi:IS30 family transposase
MHCAVIVHLVERVSRYGLALLLPGKDALPLSAAVWQRLKELPPGLRRSLSCDRGTEFSKLRNCKLKVYACNPYSAWEKGSVENQNGLLRRYLPRRTDLSTLSQDQLSDIRAELNNRPMKVLGYQTPREVLSSQLQLSVALHL